MAQTAIKRARIVKKKNCMALCFVGVVRGQWRQGKTTSLLRDAVRSESVTAEDRGSSI